MLAARERFEAQQNSLLAGSPASSPKSKDKKDKKDKDDKKDKKDKKDVPSSSASSVAGGGGGSDDPVEAAFKAALDSGEWKKKEDPSTKKTYYYNTKSKKTTWDLKKDIKKELAAKAPDPAAEPAPVQQAPAQAAPTTTAQTQPTPQPTTTSAPQSQPQPQPVPQQQPTTSAPGQPATTHGYDSLPPQRQSPPPAASSSSAMAGQHFPNLSVPSYVDPVERLINHNAQLQQLIAGGSKGSVALDFQQRYDALERTNNALSVQLERLKNEHRSMAQALAEANTRIHEQQSQLAACRPTIGDRSRDEEMQLTFSHLREQNRVLITQVSELSTMLARGLNESAAKMADFNAGLSAQHDARVGSANSPANETGARLATKFLDSQARHSLCPNCVLNVTRYRDQLLSPQETNVGRLPSAAHPARDGADAVPSYRPVSDLTQPPPSQYYSEPQPQQYSSVGRSASHNTNSGFTYGVPPRSVSLGPHGGNTGGGSASHHAPSGDGSGGGGGSGGPAVMYGGFVIRNPSGGQR